MIFFFVEGGTCSLLSFFFQRVIVLEVTRFCLFVWVAEEALEAFTKSEGYVKVTYFLTVYCCLSLFYCENGLMTMMFHTYSTMCTVKSEFC